MKITVTQVDDDVICEFMPYGLGDLRLWIRDGSQWFQTVGRWCPHINVNGFECMDCAMNFE